MLTAPLKNADVTVRNATRRFFPFTTTSTTRAVTGSSEATMADAPRRGREHYSLSRSSLQWVGSTPVLFPRPVDATQLFDNPSWRRIAGTTRDLEASSAYGDDHRTYARDDSVILAHIWCAERASQTAAREFAAGLPALRH